METNDAQQMFAALAQETRLQVVKLLVRHEPEGLPAGAIADALQTPQPTLSFHLAQLTRAGLLESQREGRVIRYRVQLDAMWDLVAFLLADCCQGDPARCAPLLDDILHCGQSAK